MTDRPAYPSMLVFDVASSYLTCVGNSGVAKGGPGRARARPTPLKSRSIYSNRTVIGL